MLEVAAPLNAPTSTLVSMNGPAASVTVTTGPATSGGFSASSPGWVSKKSTLPTWLVTPAELLDEMLLLKVVRSDDPGASTVSVVTVGAEVDAERAGRFGRKARRADVTADAERIGRRGQAGLEYAARRGGGHRL